MDRGRVEDNTKMTKIRAIYKGVVQKLNISRSTLRGGLQLN